MPRVKSFTGSCRSGTVMMVCCFLVFVRTSELWYPSHFRPVSELYSKRLVMRAVPSESGTGTHQRLHDGFVSSHFTRLILQVMHPVRTLNLGHLAAGVFGTVSSIVGPSPSQSAISARRASCTGAAVGWKDDIDVTWLREDFKPSRDDKVRSAVSVRRTSRPADTEAESVAA